MEARLHYRAAVTVESEAAARPLPDAPPSVSD